MARFFLPSRYRHVEAADAYSEYRHTPGLERNVIKFTFRPGRMHCSSLNATRVWLSRSSHLLRICYFYLLSVITTTFPAVQFQIFSHRWGEKSPVGFEPGECIIMAARDNSHSKSTDPAGGIINGEGERFILKERKAVI